MEKTDFMQQLYNICNNAKKATIEIMEKKNICHINVEEKVEKGEAFRLTKAYWGWSESLCEDTITELRLSNGELEYHLKNYPKDKWSSNWDECYMQDIIDVYYWVNEYIS